MPRVVMTPIDLRTRAPRAPRAALGGVTFLPRSIDKVRASLAGGDLGPYAIEGFTVMMLDILEIALDDFRAEVERAQSDAEIERYVLGRSSEKRRARWEAFIAAREPRGGNRAEALVAYPWLHERPDLILALDVLAEDDARLFA